MITRLPVARWTLRRAHARLPVQGLVLIASLLALPAHAQPAEAVESSFKLTYGWYNYSNSTQGHDLNLRWEHGTTRAWLGHYGDPTFGHQTRAGIEHTFTLTPILLMQLSVETASRHYFGAAMNVALGNPVFVLVGLERTNLRPYFNLDFNPNDALTVGLGWKSAEGSLLAVAVVADNRLDTGQKIFHLYGRHRFSDAVRLSFDLSRKRADNPDGSIKGWGLSATLDFPSWFLRLAREQRQNFEDYDATRLTVGMRF